MGLVFLKKKRALKFSRYAKTKHGLNIKLNSEKKVTVYRIILERTTTNFSFLSAKV